ncbi:protein-cysteine N-palmitoyltransferase HHAT isoform X4 [Erinaceus europaeus]|nr:protein-cysteine N-palmitoyltransferase HHAT isoform X4 [Erinaceus europaeus]
MEWGRRRLGWLLLGHAALSQVSTLLAKQHRPWVLTAYGVWACWRALDTPGLALALLHVAVCLGIAQLRSPLLSWLCALLLLCSLRLDTAVDGKGGWPDGPQSERDLLRFSLTVRCLFCTAASLERGLCGAPLPWVLAYLFYYPTFHNGPVLSFPRFCAQMRCPQPLSPGARLALLVAGLGRLLCWWALAELLAQLMYTHALCASPTLLGTVSAWTLGGLALAQVHFFYVKYLVLFGVPALLMRLDGLVPPPQPRCVSTMFSFSGMWRYFDVGLHEFLIRYVYVPAGGSRHGPLGTLLSTALTFSFVSFWHGGQDDLWCWAALNWLGLSAESGARWLAGTPRVRRGLARHLSPAARRRLHAGLASCSTCLLILANLVFLGGCELGQVYWDRVFLQGWPWVTLLVLGFLYCYAHVGIAWAQTYAAH